jgi:soluble lytic murein transglycosylase-like protein
MRAVSWCESRWNARAVGRGSLGLFQFLPATWTNTPYRARSIFDPFANALAAAWLVSHDGGWFEWTCRP